MANLCLNEDSSHYFVTRKEQSGNLREMQNLILQYCGSNVKTFLLNPNAQKTSFRSKVWESIGDPADREKEYWDHHPVLRDWMQAVRDMEKTGMDPYVIWINTLREIGISPWISMRMNDVHHANDLSHPLHGSFYRNNPQYRRAMYRDRGWEDRQLNYMFEEVRNHHMQLIREYFGKYDFDGLELDWMRFGNHFATGQCDEGRPVLDQFMEQVKKLALEWSHLRGRPIRIGVRVPADPLTAFDMGMDAMRWAQEGWVDRIVPSPFWETSQHDIPVEMWKKLVRGTGTDIFPCLEICLRQTRFSRCTLSCPFNRSETIRGAALSLLDRGADGIYLFNYMDRLDAFYTETEYREILSETGKQEIMRHRPMRFVFTFHDRKPDGKPWDDRLPDSLIEGAFHEYRLHTGNLKGICSSKVVLSFSGRETVTAADVAVYVNGELCPVGKIVDIPQPKPATPCIGWEIPDAGFKNGYQVVEVVAKTSGLMLEWVEITCCPSIVA